MKAPPAVPWLLGFGGVGLLLAAVQNRHPLQLFSARASGAGTVDPIYTPADAGTVQGLRSGAGATGPTSPTPAGTGADLGLSGGTLPGDAGRSASRFDDYPGYPVGKSGPHGKGLYRGPKVPLPAAASDGCGWRPVTANKYTGRPVDSHGLTHAACHNEWAVRQAFPRETASWGKNYAVDRNVGHSTDPNANESPHGYGEADDFYPASGSLKWPDANGLAGGDTIAVWLARQMWAGSLPISYVLGHRHIANHDKPNTWEAVGPGTAHPGTDPHETHIHCNARVPA